MIKYFAIILILISTGCMKRNQVYYCGDHICNNKKEAEAYFNKNLSLEIVLKNKQKDEPFNLLKLNETNNTNTAKTKDRGPLFKLINNKIKTNKNGINIEKKEVLNKNKNLPSNNKNVVKRQVPDNKLYKFLNTERKKKNTVKDKLIEVKKSDIVNKDKVVKNKILNRRRL